MCMSNLDLLEKLPDSIFATNPGSNNYKLWKLFSFFIDELDEVFLSLKLMTDVATGSGVVLDLIGKILRQKRQGWGDDKYIKYLFVAIRKFQCSGSIPDLNEICRLLIENEFYYIRDMNYPELEDAFWLDGSIYLGGDEFLSGETNNPDAVYLNGEEYLDGSFYLSGDICQPRFFEVVLSNTLSSDTLDFINEIIHSCKGGGIKYRIRLEE